MPVRPENRARYPADWKDIVARIRVRSGDRCECRGECGRAVGHLWTDGRCMNRQGEAAWLTLSRVVLTTAHRDHVPEHCDDDNLFHACQGCHLAYDREHHAETAYRTRREGRAASDLFSPSPKEGSTMQDPTPTTPDTTEAAATAPAPAETPAAPIPNIRRVVWYYPGVNEKEHPSYGQPHSAQVACVHSHGCVNLGIFDGNGIAYSKTSVSLYHPDAVPEWQRNNGHYATWMPYQVR
jgi:hypothetical protein